MKRTFDVTGMTCAACSSRVEKATAGVAGVDGVAVNLLKNSMEVDYDGSDAVAAAISAAVEKPATARSCGPSLAKLVRRRPPRGLSTMRLPRQSA